MCKECCTTYLTKFKKNENGSLEREYLYNDSIDIDVSQNFEGESCLVLNIENAQDYLSMDLVLEEVDELIRLLHKKREELVEEMKKPKEE